MSVRDTPILIYYPSTGTWHPIHKLSWCRNVTLRSSYTILVSERDTPILIYYPGTGTWHPIHIFYPGVGMWHPIHILSWCRNVALQSIYYPGTGMWHPIHILSWCQNVTLRSSYTILVPERGTRSPNLTTCSSILLFYQGIISNKVDKGFSRFRIQ